MALFLFVLKFAEIHDAHDRRNGTVGDQHQIQSHIAGKIAGFRQRDDIHLFPFGTDKTDLIGGECPIIRFEQLSYNSTLPSTGI
jgi:hypothetical protein